MAKLSADGKYVIVESGDTLSEIARDFGKGATYQQIAAVNNISSPYRIYVGQKIYLTKQTSSSSTTKKTAPSNKAKIDHFGVQSNTNNTLFATWTWSKKNTENYDCQWYYATGDGVWFVGNKSSTTDKQCTYDIRDNATKVRFRVKPVSKKYKKNDKETSYWTAEWTDFKIFDVKTAPPPTPSGMTVKMEKFKLTVELTNLDANTKKVEFQVVKNDSKVFKTATVAVKTSAASFSCTVDAGAEYKVRCRGINGEAKSAWSEYSENTTTVPAAPAGIKKLKATSQTSVQIDWENVKNATSYRVEWTTVLHYFDSNSDAVGYTEKTRDDNGLIGHAEIEGLETGKEYFFRVRAGNDIGISAWTEVKSIVLGKKPTAPTTWSSTTTGKVGEDLNLYWVHNAQDGSNQTYAEVELIIGGVTETHTIDTTKDYTSGRVSYKKPEEKLEEGEVVTSCVTLNITDYVEGTKILWRVRTAGITKDLGEWSIQRTIDVYAPPTLQVSVELQNGDIVETLEEFPFYISAIAGPDTQTPIGYHVSIISNETYETTDNIGNLKIVSAGDDVYAKYFDITTDLMIEMSAGNIDLENGMTYTVKVVASMNSGLTSESSAEFSVSWIDAEYAPNAEISVDQDTYTAHIRPYCETSEMIYSEVVNGALGYETVANIFDFVSGEPVEGAFTTTGEQVYFGTTADGEEVYYCEFIVSSLAEGVTLSVYRREFDGTFTEIATGIDNNSYTTVTDPHPSLDYARYRVVATDDATGGISYYDLPGYPVGETAVIIQWDEEWSSFDTTSADALEEPAWSGSLLRLPYNIDISDKHSSDVSFVSYAGRKHPVTYYGTQLGETSSWSVEIRKDDVDTLYALRRLAIWMGDVYVREPSGSGYWANVSVSFSQKHCDLTIPVTLEITRVEGGM